MHRRTLGNFIDFYVVDLRYSDVMAASDVITTVPEPVAWTGGSV